MPIDFLVRRTQLDRRRFPAGLSFRAGSALPGGAFTRTSAATYVAEIPDLQFLFVGGSDLSSATISRASTATYTGEALS